MPSLINMLWRATRASAVSILRDHHVNIQEAIINTGREGLRGKWQPATQDSRQLKARWDTCQKDWWHLDPGDGARNDLYKRHFHNVSGAFRQEGHTKPGGRGSWADPWESETHPRWLTGCFRTGAENGGPNSLSLLGVMMLLKLSPSRCGGEGKRRPA